MFSGTALMFPLYIMMSQLGLIWSKLALILSSRDVCSCFADDDYLPVCSENITEGVATTGLKVWHSAMSYFFDVTDGERTLRAGLHGGMGINTLSKEFLDKYSLPYELRNDFKRSMYN